MRLPMFGVALPAFAMATLPAPSAEGRNPNPPGAGSHRTWALKALASDDSSEAVRSATGLGHQKPSAVTAPCVAWRCVRPFW